mgnify:CR=1 FL=1
MNSVFNYPTNMTFFTTPELLEIGDIPLRAPDRNRPGRRRSSTTVVSAEHFKLHICQYQWVRL